MKASTIALSASILLLALPGAARADSCVDLKTGQTWDCKGPPPSAKGQPAPGNASDSGLRDKLLKSLGSSGQPSQNQAFAARITGAAQRANNAIISGSMANDPQERAQFKRDYEAARRDFDQASDEAARANPAQRDAILAAKRDEDANFDQKAQQAGLANVPPTQQAATPAAPPAVAAAPDPNLFSTCGAADRRGIQTCYEAGPSGYGCRKLLKQGGDSVWSEDQATCDSSAVLQQRNDYFNKLKAQGPRQEFGADSQRKEAALSGLSPQCKAQLNSMMQGADAGDREKALSSYGSLRAQCDAQIRALANAAESDLPERVLSDRARGAMAKAMSRDPATVAEAIVDRGDGGSYDPSEVIDFALGLLNVMSGFAGMYTPMAHGASASYSGTVYRRAGVSGTYGQGAPSQPAPRYSPSTITGTGR